jgi:hypothetical protein
MSDDPTDDPDALWRESARQYHQERRRSEFAGSGGHRIAIDGDAEVEQLSVMSPLEYYRIRKTAAKRLEIGVRELDRLVGNARKSAGTQDDDPPHWVVEAAAESVDGARLLDSIKATFEKYLVLPPHAADAITLWVMHTWTIDASDISPYLALISPSGGAGKRRYSNCSIGSRSVLPLPAISRLLRCSDT